MADRAPRIRPFEARELTDASRRRYDGALASLGFEERSREIPEHLGLAGLAVPFNENHRLEYDRNLAWFEAEGWEIPAEEGQGFFEIVEAWLAAMLSGGGPARVAVDVSSMSRSRIAAVVEAVLSLPTEADLEVDFLYTPAEYEDYDEKLEPPIFSVEPVSEYFAAWWTKLDLPLFAIVGLGYELEMASSALDLLEPQDAQAFVPEGSDPRYLAAVRKANAGIGDWCGVDPVEVPYPVSDPFACFRTLEARVSRLQVDHRIALIPLGPKIFALVATLVGALHPRGVQVIRVSAGKHQDPLPRRSDGTLYGLTLSLRPPPLPDEGRRPMDQAT